MVDRYTWTKSDMERSTDGFWVTAHDYDALKAEFGQLEMEAGTLGNDNNHLRARLAEAERLLRNVYAMLHGKTPPDHPFTISNVFEFLQLNSSADSAPVCKCDMRTKLVGDGCAVCNPELAAEYTASTVNGVKP